TPVNSATMVGPLTNAYAASVITTWSARPSSSAGPDTAGPSTMMTVGTTPEQSASAFAARPQPCNAENPSTMSAPLDRITHTNGTIPASALAAACSSIEDESLDNAPLRSL